MPEEPPGKIPPESTRACTTLTAETAPELWAQAVASLTGFAAEYAKQFERIAISAPNRLVISFRPRYTLAKTYCAQNAARFEQALEQLVGQPIRVEFVLSEEALEAEKPAEPVRVINPHQRLAEVSQHAMVRRAAELFGAQPIRVDEPPASG